MKNTLLISFFVFIFTFSFSQLYTVGSPTHNTTVPALSSINSFYEDSRVQYIYSASELQASGAPNNFSIDAIHLLIFDLPVELISFNGHCNGSTIDIHWNTASEYNSSHFILEHSRDGIYWTEIDIKESAGISTELRNYDFTHEGEVSSINYYRLLQVDIEGTIKKYSPIVVSCSERTSGELAVYPNPSFGSFQIIIKNFITIGESKLMLVNAAGAEVWGKTIEIGNGINTFVVSDELDARVYYLILIDKNFKKQVVKQVIK